MRTSPPRDLLWLHTVIQSPHTWVNITILSSLWLISMGLLSQAFIYGGWRRLCKHQLAWFLDQNKQIYGRYVALIANWRKDPKDIIHPAVMPLPLNLRSFTKFLVLPTWHNFYNSDPIWLSTGINKPSSWISASSSISQADQVKMGKSNGKR